MRIVIFTDYDNTATLVEATLAEAARRPDCDVVAVYTSAARLLEPRRRLRSWRRRLGALRRGRKVSSARRAAGVCRRWDVPLLLVPDGDPNSSVFIDDMKGRWSPDVALSYWSISIFKEAWLDAFSRAVNFHDGRIPDHRGVGATTMEVYEGLADGGYTFHHIDRGIDTGNVLVEGTVPIAGLGMMDIIEAKLVAAGQRVGEVLDMLEAGDPGRVQEGIGSYTSMADLNALGTLEDPSTIDWAELQRRLDALGAVALPVRGRQVPVTRIALRRGIGRPRVDLADGPVRVSRIRGVASVLFMAGRAGRGWLRFNRRGPAW